MVASAAVAIVDHARTVHKIEAILFIPFSPFENFPDWAAAGQKAPQKRRLSLAAPAPHRLTVVAAPPVPEYITEDSVLRALDGLPEDYRAAVLLCDVEEFSYKEIAAVLNVPIGTVMSRISRGRKLLREQLSELARSYGIGRRGGEGCGA